MADEKTGEAAPTDDAKVAEPAGPKMILGMPLLIFVLVILNLLLMMSGFGYIYWVKMVFKSPAITDTQVVQEIQKKVEKKAPDLEASKEVFVESYSDMTINLRSAQGGWMHYVSVQMALACNSEACQRELKNLKAKVEDTIQSTISTKSYLELSSVESKFRLKHEILKQVNTYLSPGNVVIDVYFNNLVVQ